MTVSKSLKKLVTRGLVTRHEYAKDTRAKSVKLTKLGMDFVMMLVPIVEDIDEKFFARLAYQERKDLITILRALSVK